MSSPASSAESGILWWSDSADEQPIRLVVDRGRVVDCTPYAASWAMGRTSGQLLERGRQRHATVEWVPVAALPARLRWPDGLKDVERLRRWRHHGHHESHLSFGQRRDEPAGWTLHDSRDGVDGGAVWVYPHRDDAVAEIERRLRDGDWTRTRAGYGPRGEPVDDPVLDWFDEPI
jgi:hypothetical protein